MLEATGGTAKNMIPQVEATSAQGLNSPPSIPNSQGSITDGIDNVSLNHRVEGDANVEQTEKGAEDARVRPPSTPPPASTGQIGQQGEELGGRRKLRSGGRQEKKGETKA